ncbi:unknown [Clostridium sp. CAG:433]|jgi:hypothetical protein|nr:unknown [Clostridium sp. CAG:433]
MNKKLKIFIIGILLILVTGCSGNYNLKINDDMSINEELYLTIDNSNNAYTKTLKIFKENNIPEDDYEVVLSDNNVRITYNKKYDSIEEYLLNSKVYHELIDEIQFNKSNNYIDLYVNQKLKVSNDNGIKMNGTNLVDLDVLQINIENPFDVNFSNAEIVNDNVYTWTIKKGDTEKKIQMQFKPSLNIFPYKQVAVLSTVIVCILIIIFTIYGRYKKRQKI